LLLEINPKFTARYVQRTGQPHRHSGDTDGLGGIVVADFDNQAAMFDVPPCAHHSWAHEGEKPEWILVSILVVFYSEVADSCLAAAS